ncbi:MAG: hypothetical protein WCC04_18200 [Terriglobales bacterium]
MNKKNVNGFLSKDKAIGNLLALLPSWVLVVQFLALSFNLPQPGVWNLQVRFSVIF